MEFDEEALRDGDMVARSEVCEGRALVRWRRCRCKAYHEKSLPNA